MSPRSVRSNTLSPGSPAWGGPVRTSWMPIEKVGGWSGLGWWCNGSGMDNSFRCTCPVRAGAPTMPDVRGAREVTQNLPAHSGKTPLQVQESEDSTRAVANP